jgi:hypothetical protein
MSYCHEEANPLEAPASAQISLPSVPTAKILAISHFMGTPMTPAQRSHRDVRISDKAERKVDVRAPLS